MKFNVSDIYKGRLEVIEQQQKQARLKKGWTTFYQLKVEKERIKQIIKSLPTANEGGVKIGTNAGNPGTIRDSN